MCAIDLEPCEVFKKTQHKARKEHVCQCCSRVVKKGETYVRLFMKFDGHISVERSCLDCEEDHKVFAAAPGHMGSAPSYFTELLQECISEDYFEDDEDDTWEPTRVDDYHGRTTTYIYSGKMQLHPKQDLSYKWRMMLEGIMARRTA